MPARILVVDAVATNRILLKVKLIAAKYRVLTADDGAMALAQLRIHRPDLAVLGSGAEGLIRHIRSDPAGLDVPIILISTGDGQATPGGLLRLGADAVLPPPVDSGDLVAIARQLLRRKQAITRISPEPALWGLSEQKPSSFKTRPNTEDLKDETLVP